MSPLHPPPPRQGEIWLCIYSEFSFCYCLLPDSSLGMLNKSCIEANLLPEHSLHWLSSKYTGI